jgi:hypothetical protein
VAFRKKVAERELAQANNGVITVNARSYTIIMVHKAKKK